MLDSVYRLKTELHVQVENDLIAGASLQNAAYIAEQTVANPDGGWQCKAAEAADLRRSTEVPLLALCRATGPAKDSCRMLHDNKWKACEVAAFHGEAAIP